MANRPNIVYVFADQWRGDAVGYAGDPNVVTPHLDALRQQSINCENAVANCPVCTPSRATLLTGQYPLTHGLYLNDIPLAPDAVTIGKIFSNANYDTTYIGKWHVDGHSRSQYIPTQRRQGFDDWRVLECTHDYNASAYYDNNDTTKRMWDGYDALAQTRAAAQYITSHAGGRVSGTADKKPFLLLLSWGPPHDPYQTAPAEYRAKYDPKTLTLRPNVPAEVAEKAAQDLAGYYAHITAMDDCIDMLVCAMRDAGIENNTIFIVTSDHGDMHGSHFCWNKQRFWDESVRIPMLIRYPDRFGKSARTCRTPIGIVDMLPTLLNCCDIQCPSCVQGSDMSHVLDCDTNDSHDDHAALIACYAPFGISNIYHGGFAWRGLRTRQHTYVRSIHRPLHLYDNQADPYQLNNLIDSPAHAEWCTKLEGRLIDMLAKQGDAMLEPHELNARYGYTVDHDGATPYQI